MDEFFAGAQPQRFELIFEEIFHGLDVVIGLPLDAFDRLGVFQAEIPVNGPQSVKRVASTPARGGRGNSHRAIKYSISTRTR